MAQKAKSAGTVFSSRDEALRDFKTKYAPQYSTSFSAEPVVRPDYIPQMTTYSGRPVTVVYNNTYRNYGYWDDNRWLAYDVLADVAIADSLMRRRSYYYGSPPVYGGAYAHSDGPTHNDGPIYNDGPIRNNGYVPANGYAGPYGNSNSYVAAGHSSGGSLVGVFFGLLILAVIVTVFVLAFRAIQRSLQTQGAGRLPPLPLPSQAPWPVAGPPARPNKPAGDMLDSTTPEFWETLKVGVIITLRDELAMKDSLAKTGKADGISYTAVGIRRVAESRNLAHWTMLRLQGNYREFKDQLLWLVAKTIDRQLDLAVYEELHDIAPGNRRDFVERGDKWLFQQPEDPSRIEYDKLQYTSDFTRNVESPGGSVEITFVQKPQGELFGTCTQQPAPSGLGKPLLAGIVEYATDQPCDNPQIMVMEVGNEESPSGGNITMMEGSRIAAADIDVL